MVFLHPDRVKAEFLSMHDFFECFLVKLSAFDRDKTEFEGCHI
jgi:hypothetical protein